MEVTQKKKKRGNPYLQGIHIKTPSRNMTPWIISSPKGIFFLNLW
jgi:hypothetical protein